MAHKSRIGCIVLDCKTSDLAEATRFWSAALGYKASDNQPDPKYVDLGAPEGEPRVLLQAVDHDSRVHLDVETDDKEAEARRLEALGARRVAALKGWIVMEAPTGHRFCLVGPQRAGFERDASRWSED